jgi:hypothetical protein
MIFEPNDLEGKDFKVKTVHNEAGEQVALWYACHSGAFGAFLWNLAVNTAYSSKAEIDQAIEREMLKLARQGMRADRDTAMRRLIVRSGLFVAPPAIQDELRAPEQADNAEDDG